ncbi:hypothetical protein AVEN_176601-1, partial [Araneus ventricosus]
MILSDFLPKVYQGRVWKYAARRAPNMRSRGRRPPAGAIRRNGERSASSGVVVISMVKVYVIQAKIALVLLRNGKLLSSCAKSLTIKLF